MAQLNTKLVIRNDSLENWEAHKNVVLLKGEMGIAFDADGKNYIKIGDGVKTWEQLDWYGNEQTGASFFDVEFSAADIDDMAAIARVVGNTELLDGDVAVVKHMIAEGKYTHTGYTYSAGEWKAMDGNYNAENVYFDEDLVTTTAIGNITLSNGQATIASTGKNLKEVWEAIFVKEKNPSTTQPSVSITFGNAGSYEVGETISTPYSITLNKGSYTYGPATGVTMTSVEVVDSLGTKKTEQSGNFDNVTVTDDMNYTITATATYGDGAIPVTNRGNAYATGQIKGGSKSATSSAITGYRNTFWGALESKDGEIDSAYIRNLANKSGAAFANGSEFTIDIPTGAMRIMFAYPATLRDVSSVKDENAMGAQISGTFAATKTIVKVEGYNGASSIDYKVYCLDVAEPAAKSNKYYVII